MTPAARLQAAIEIVDLVIASASEDGPPADSIVSGYFKTRRYAGSGDRRAVRELVYRAIRRHAERPSSGRCAILGLAEDDPKLAPLFGEPRGPEALREGESAAAAGTVPAWLIPELSPLVAKSEWPALLERAPLDLRVNIARSSREEVLAELGEGEATRLSPWGVRLPADSRVDDRSCFNRGIVEVQDEGSQLIALACLPAHGRVLDLCAGAGGKALAIAAAAQSAQILGTDTNRARLSRLAPRAERAGTHIETRLLNPPKEAQELADWCASAEVVLVDAPCSGSGTWRRSPEGRWRLTPERLDRLIDVQKRLLDLGADMVRPGGHLVYAVCSLLSREGAVQAADFLSRHSLWKSEDPLVEGGRPEGVGRLLTPAHDATDGFFIARFVRPC
ncbi:MAG: RsmB/NOP family class I SAM-dependent RNA methyltransferase [Sphingomicrobium sp.]